MRFVVVGTSGSGKSTFAKMLACKLGCPHHELDEFHWGPNWTPKDPEEFRKLVRRAASGDRWVIDGNYSIVRDILWSRASHVVWLNFSFPLVISRVVLRTLRRSLSAQYLWHGNRETIKKAIFSRESIILWSLTTFRKNRRKYNALRDNTDFSHLEWLEFKRSSEAAAYLGSARTDG